MGTKAFLGSHRLTYERKKKIAGGLFAIPWIVGTCVFFLLPLIQSFLFSIGKISVAENGLQVDLVGWEHYVRAFTEDASFLPMLVDSVPKLLYQVPIILIFSLIEALLINQKFRGRTVVRAIFFLPIIIANGIIISIIRGDAFSNVLMGSASAGQMFKSEMLAAMLREMSIGTSLVEGITGVVNNIFDLLWNSGIQTLLFLAALQTVPVSMYEAAKIEGGTSWENFWKITFPMLGPTILINIVYTIVETFNNYGNSVVMYVNNLAMNASFEYSAALSWIYAIVVVVFLAIAYGLVNRVVYYEV